jgi:hypothetical protein
MAGVLPSPSHPNPTKACGFRAGLRQASARIVALAGSTLKLDSSSLRRTQETFCKVDGDTIAMRGTLPGIFSNSFVMQRIRLTKDTARGWK